MMFTPKLLLFTGLIAVSGRDTTPPNGANRQPTQASLRFVNRLPDNASVAANGNVVFNQVASGSVTGWSTARDTITTFTLTRGTTDTIRATTSAQLVNGSYYTVSASGGTDGSPVVLAVVRDNGPDDTANVMRPTTAVTKP